MKNEIPGLWNKILIHEFNGSLKASKLCHRVRNLSSPKRSNGFIKSSEALLSPYSLHGRDQSIRKSSMRAKRYWVENILPPFPSKSIFFHLVCILTLHASIGDSGMSAKNSAKAAAVYFKFMISNNITVIVTINLLVTKYMEVL